VVVVKSTEEECLHFEVGVWDGVGGEVCWGLEELEVRREGKGGREEGGGELSSVRWVRGQVPTNWWQYLQKSAAVIKGRWNEMRKWRESNEGGREDWMKLVLRHRLRPGQFRPAGPYFVRVQELKGKKG